jgi:hypothetical protein
VDTTMALVEASASIPVNPVRGSGVLALVVIVGLLLLFIPTRK